MRAFVLALVLLVAPRAFADDDGHRLSVYARSHVLLHLSPHQTSGGAGGGLGVRDTIDGLWVLQADVSHLFMIGNVVAFRFAGGVQLPKLYSPAALVTASVFAGGRLRFLKEDHTEPVALPTTSLGLTLAPLRFRWKGATVSIAELGLGLGSDLPGRGTAIQLGLVEVGAAF